MHQSADVGSVGFPHRLFTFGEFAIRGTFIFDRWHVWMCEWEGALAYGHLALGRALIAVELNMLHGAFDKDLNFAKLNKCGKCFS